METLPHRSDLVQIRRGLFVEIARVVDAYDSAIGGRVTVQVPADPQYGDEVTTYNLPVEDLTTVPSPGSA